MLNIPQSRILMLRKSLMSIRNEITKKAGELLDLLDGNEELAIEAVKARHRNRLAGTEGFLSVQGSAANVIISTHSLTKTYELGKQTLKAVEDISINIREGELVAIVGASGSGKSTLLQLMGGLDRPTSGQVVLNGEDIAKFNDKQLSEFRNKTVGFIFQFFYLQPFLTLSRNIEIPSMPLHVSASYRHKRTTELLRAVGLANEGERRPSQLSGGQIQRAAIARALYNNPKIILADEPTGNLDSKNSKLIVDLLVDVRREFGTTIVIVTHDNEIADHADRVITMADGKII